MSDYPNKDIAQWMQDMGNRARNAALLMASATSERKNFALNAMAKILIKEQNTILSANAVDVKAAQEANRSPSFVERLQLDEQSIHKIVESVCMIAELADPVGDIIARWDRPNGLQIERVRTPLGVIGIIFESRPNVTADAGALCLKAGNASILRSGSDSLHSARAIHACLVKGLKTADLPIDAIQLVPVADRAAVGLMLSGLEGTIDVIVPRGGKSLVARVQNEARVPVFSHLEGLCHVYIDGGANMEMAREIIVNAKMRRTGICGAAETLLFDRAIADTHVKPILQALVQAGCTIRACEDIRAIFPNCAPAKKEDWSKEYLDALLSVTFVGGVDGAIKHIRRYSSGHTESIVTDDLETAGRFMNEIDSAIVMHNVSTQFADGGEFGMGAEIGIATGKMHARGPVGVEQLTSFKYQVHGCGQIRS